MNSLQVKDYLLIRKTSLAIPMVLHFLSFSLTACFFGGYEHETCGENCFHFAVTSEHWTCMCLIVVISRDQNLGIFFLWEKTIRIV